MYSLWNDVCKQLETFSPKTGRGGWHVSFASKGRDVLGFRSLPPSRLQAAHAQSVRKPQTKMANRIVPATSAERSVWSLRPLSWVNMPEPLKNANVLEIRCCSESSYQWQKRMSCLFRAGNQVNECPILCFLEGFCWQSYWMRISSKHQSSFWWFLIGTLRLSTAMKKMRPTNEASIAS